MSEGFKAPPIAGYQDVSADKAGQVNHNKLMEEEVLRRLDALKAIPGIDGRWLAIGRTHIEEGFMAINRSIFQPGRVQLPSDVNNGD
jgi:hypothetical protein